MNIELKEIVEIMEIKSRVFRKEMFYAQRHGIYKFDSSIINMSYQELEDNYFKMATALKEREQNSLQQEWKKCLTAHAA